MKKELLLAGAVLMMAAAAVTGYTAYSKTNVPELLNANVEALARDESSNNAYEQGAVCTRCGRDIRICVYCPEWNCGSCWVSSHGC